MMSLIREHFTKLGGETATARDGLLATVGTVAAHRNQFWRDARELRRQAERRPLRCPGRTLRLHLDHHADLGLERRLQRTNGVADELTEAWPVAMLAIGQPGMASRIQPNLSLHCTRRRHPGLGRRSALGLEYNVPWVCGAGGKPVPKPSQNAGDALPRSGRDARGCKLWPGAGRLFHTIHAVAPVPFPGTLGSRAWPSRPFSLRLLPARGLAADLA